jgi:hypothetical protein
MHNGDQKIKLELTIDEINVVLNALGQMPYVQVVNILNNISRQAESQFKSKEDTDKQSK